MSDPEHGAELMGDLAEFAAGVHRPESWTAIVVDLASDVWSDLADADDDGPLYRMVIPRKAAVLLLRQIGLDEVADEILSDVVRGAMWVVAFDPGDDAHYFQVEFASSEPASDPDDRPS